MDEAACSAMKRLCQVNLTELFKNYPEYVIKLGERNGKSIWPFEIEAESCLLVDEKKFSAFARALVHVFRNAVVHGIEEPDTRLQRGKSESGSIQCRLWEEGDTIFIEIEDDGCGIDTEKITARAVQLGLLQAGSLEPGNGAELLDLLFADGFSTTEEPDQYSGRGEGLAAVKHELELLGGSAYIRTVNGKGTVFGFAIKKC